MKPNRLAPAARGHRRIRVVWSLIAFIAMTSGAASWTAPAGARVIYVPAHFPTIQQAIEDASAGDTVLVAAGTYSRTWIKTIARSGGDVQVTTNVLVDRPIVLAGEAGAEATVIQGAGSGPVVVVTNAGSAVIRGFTIRGGLVDERVLDGGGGIYCESSEIEICENIIEGNGAPFGAGIGCFGASISWIHDNVIRNNSECEFGAGLAFLGGSSTNRVTIEFNVIADNRAEVLGGALFVNEQSSVTVRRNTIVNNHATSGSAIFCRGGAEVEASRNIIAMSTGGVAVYCDTLSVGSTCALDLLCNDFWRNEGGSWEGCVAGAGNRDSDPLFCSHETGDFSLCAFSPSLLDGGECGARGALPFGCLNCPVQEKRLSWGFLKALYR